MRHLRQPRLALPLRHRKPQLLNDQWAQHRRIQQDSVRRPPHRLDQPDLREPLRVLEHPPQPARQAQEFRVLQVPVFRVRALPGLRRPVRRLVEALPWDPRSRRQLLSKKNLVSWCARGEAVLSRKRPVRTDNRNREPAVVWASAWSPKDSLRMIS
jgi:hypothetical protein